MKSLTWNKLIDEVKKNSIMLLPTDTIYGFHCSVDNETGIKKINDLKKRSSKKTFIILIHNLSELKKFKINVTGNQDKVLRKIWPGEVSVVFDYTGKEYKILSKNFGSLAFRVPKHHKLRALLQHTGPLISTSANITGQKTTLNPQTIPKELSNKIDFCVNSKIKTTEPSVLLKVLR